MSRKTRKLMWSVPLIAAVAVIGALAAFMTLQPNQAEAQADQPPGKVGMLTADAYDDGVPQEEIELTWNAPTDGGLASHYRIDISTNGGYTWVALEDSIRNTRHLHDDLKANQTLHYRVFAVNSIGASPVSDIANATTTETDVPDRPTNLSAAVGTEGTTATVADTAGELTVTLTWDPPQDPPGAPILGYIVEYSDDGDRWIELKTVADEGSGQQTTTHPMLDAGIEYHYRVAAYNKTMKNADDEDVPNPSFTSGWTETADAETLMGDMPDPPTPLEPGVSPAVTGVWLYWTPPTNTEAIPNADPMGDPITAYEVEGRPTSTMQDHDDDDETPDQLTECLVADCPFQVIKTDIDRPSGTVINSFQVTARDVNANTTYDASFTVENPWAYRIRAINRRANDEATIAAGTDETAATAAALLITNSKSAIIAVPARTNTSLQRPENLVITRSEPDNEGRTGLVLRWNRAETLPYNHDEAGIDGGTPDTDGTLTPNQSTFAVAYRIEYSDDGPPDSAYDWKVLIPIHEATATAQQTYTDNHLTQFGEDNATATDNDLRAGQERHYRVFALVGNTAGAEMSWPSEQKSGTTAVPVKPERPTNLSARAGNPAGHTTIDLTWTAPDATNDDNDGSEEGPSVIVGYRVQYSDDEGQTWQDLVKDKDGDLMLVEGTKHTDKGLMPGQTRDYRVAAANMVGSRYQYSTWSNSDSAKTTPAPLPNEPGGLVAEADGADAIKLCWNAQAEQPEAAPVTSYLIEYSPDGKTGTWNDLATVTAMTDDQVHTVYRDTTDLGPEETRHYRVSAINLQGTSDQSDVAMATTAEAMAPSAPLNLREGLVTESEINIMWDAPASDGGAAVTGSIVEKAYGGSFLDEMRTNGDAFTDAASWWDGLDCAGMVAAVMDDRTANMDNPYCAMYADLGDDEKTEVQRIFRARYWILDDGSDMDYRNFNLDPETTRMYRVAATNAAGLGAWSEGITVTTMAATQPELMAPSMVEATAVGTEVTITWSGGDNAATFTVAMIRRDANNVWDIDNAVYDTGVTGSPHVVNMATRPAGVYHVFVVAGDGAGEWTDWVSGSVDYQP